MLLNRSKLLGYNWSGLFPPQYVILKRRYKGVVLNPPDFAPGSWRGAGKVLVDVESRTFWMTSRPRRAPPLRGYAVEIFRSTDGENFQLATTLSKEEVGSMAGMEIYSIEGQQLIKDPLTGKYRLYLSIDIGPHSWETLLLESDVPDGEWKSRGIVLRREFDYDSTEARDATIDIVDGMYFALYKANDGKRIRMALAVSSDGVNWNKHGLLRLNEAEQPDYLLLCGKIFAGSTGLLFIGTENRKVIDGAAVTDTFAAYVIDHKSLNMNRLFSCRWEPLSPFERNDYPIHSYMDLTYDPFRDRLLIYVEAIDPGDIGLNREVDRVLLYEVPL